MITLSSSSFGLPNLQLDKMTGEAEDFVSRSSVDIVRSGEATLTGTDTLIGGGARYFIWSFQCAVNFEELILFEEYRARQQNNYANRYNGAINLTDHKNWVAPGENLSNARVSHDIKLMNWGNAYLISCPVLLRVGENHFKQLAPDLYSLEFDAKEIVR